MGRAPLLASALGFVVLLGLAWLLLDRDPGTPAGPYFALGRRIPDTLTVAYGSDTTVLVPGGEAGWRVIHPVAYPADGVVVDALVKRLAALEVDRRFPLTPEKLDSYGIRHPRAVLRAAYGDGTPADTLTVGGFTFDDVYDYVRAGSRMDVGLLPSRVARGYLLKSTAELRENLLLPFPEALAREYRLLGEGGTLRVHLRWGPEAGWRILRPYPGPADRRAVGEYLESVSHMHVRSFLREDEGPLAPYGLEDPPVGIRVGMEDGAELEAVLGDPIQGTDMVYAMRRGRPTVFGVSDKYPGVLRWEADRFRRPAVVDWGLARVTRVEVEIAGRGRREYRLDTPPDSLERRVRDALGNWVLLEAKRFEEATPASLRERGLLPATRTLWWWSGVDTVARVDVGTSREGSTPLRVSEGSSARPEEILFVEEGAVEPLVRALTAPPPAP